MSEAEHPQITNRQNELRALLFAAANGIAAIQRRRSLEGTTMVGTPGWIRDCDEAIDKATEDMAIALNNILGPLGTGGRA